MLLPSKPQRQDDRALLVCAEGRTTTTTQFQQLPVQKVTGKWKPKSTCYTIGKLNFGTLLW